MSELLIFEDLKRHSPGPTAFSAAGSSIKASGTSQAPDANILETDDASKTSTSLEPSQAAHAVPIAAKDASAAQGAAASNIRSRTGATEAQQGVEAVVRRAFALLASRCMDPEPSVRPSFADAAARLEILQRAVAARQDITK
jgi:hypothetical protein